MPELPDLTVYNKNLNKLLSNNQVKKISVYRSKRINVTADELVSTLVGATLLSTTRDGKEIRFDFSSGHSLSVHLMLKGSFDVVRDENAVKHKCLSLDFGSIGSLVISDPRGWATFTLDAEPSGVPDALSSEFDAFYLRDQLKTSTAGTMKAFLVDQNVVRGIGNAYADEILWDCKVSPLSDCRNLPDEAIGRLLDSITKVLKSAIASITAAAPDSISGERRDFLKIHNPSKSLSPTRFPIRQKTISSKNTYFTDEQVIY